MRKIHSRQGKRIQNGDPFDYMLQIMAKEKNESSLLSNNITPTDVSRHAIASFWRKTGHKTIPKKALDMLNIPIEDIEI